MSSVRMCDKCSRVFSENEDGWSTFSGVRIVKNKDNGRREQIHEVQDMCGLCSAAQFGNTSGELEGKVDE